MSSVKDGTRPDNTAATERTKRKHVARKIVNFAPVNNICQIYVLIITFKRKDFLKCT